MSCGLHSSDLAVKKFPVKNCGAVFPSRGVLDELLNKFSYPGLGYPVDFIPWDPSSYSFHTLDSFHQIILTELSFTDI